MAATNCITIRTAFNIWSIKHQKMVTVFRNMSGFKIHVFFKQTYQTMKAQNTTLNFDC